MAVEDWIEKYKDIDRELALNRKEWKTREDSMIAKRDAVALEMISSEWGATKAIAQHLGVCWPQASRILDDALRRTVLRALSTRPGLGACEIKTGRRVNVPESGHSLRGVSVVCSREDSAVVAAAISSTRLAMVERVEGEDSVELVLCKLE